MGIAVCMMSNGVFKLAPRKVVCRPEGGCVSWGGFRREGASQGLRRGFGQGSGHPGGVCSATARPRYELVAPGGHDSKGNNKGLPFGHCPYIAPPGKKAW